MGRRMIIDYREEYLYEELQKEIRKDKEDELS